VLYVMLSGTPPFNGKRNSVVLRKVKLGKVKFPNMKWRATSEEAKALIHNLLAFEPTVRYTAEQALNDEWIKRLTPRPPDASLGHEFVESLWSDDEEIEPLHDLFTLLDHNKDGMLSLSELSHGLNKSCLEHAPEDVDQLMEATDSDGSGNIDYTKFLAATMVSNLYLLEPYCRAAFRTWLSCTAKLWLWKIHVFLLLISERSKAAEKKEMIKGDVGAV